MFNSSVLVMGSSRSSWSKVNARLSIKRYCNVKSKNGKETPVQDPELPEEPTTCCMSGCANCVWIEYAQEMSKILGDGGEAARDRIMEKVKDPNVRSFLLLELKNMTKKPD